MKKGHVTDYKEIRGYVLARTPDSLHMIGLMPIVRTTAFDMVSDGQDFKLWIPSKNRFVMGKNRGGTPSTDQPMENIRPQNIYEALLIRRIDPESEIAVLENGYETLHDSKGNRILQEDYELTVVQKYDKGWRLGRKIIFGRIDLKPHRQFIYSEDGTVAIEVVVICRDGIGRGTAREELGDEIDEHGARDEPQFGNALPERQASLTAA